jgi:Flp pilus assembly protein TadD
MAQKITDAEQAQQTFGRALRDTLDKAEPLLRAGRFAEAIPLYESIVQKLPTFYEAYFDLGNCYAQNGRLSDAEAAFKRYLALQPVSADGHAALGMVLAEQGRVSEAVPEFGQSLKIDPNQVEVRKALANIHMQAGDFGAAVTVLKAGGAAHDAQADTMLANALDKNGDRSSALTAVNRALAINPADAEALQLRQELLASGAARKH